MKQVVIYLLRIWIIEGIPQISASCVGVVYLKSWLSGQMFIEWLKTGIQCELKSYWTNESIDSKILAMLAKWYPWLTETITKHINLTLFPPNVMALLQPAEKSINCYIWGLLCSELNLNRFTVHQILTWDLDMRKVCAKMVPKNLITEQKANRRYVCLDLLDTSRWSQNSSVTLSQVMNHGF